MFPRPVCRPRSDHPPSELSVNQTILKERTCSRVWSARPSSCWVCCGATFSRSFRLRRQKRRHHRSPTVALLPVGRDLKGPTGPHCTTPLTLCWQRKSSPLCKSNLRLCRAAIFKVNLRSLKRDGAARSWIRRANLPCHSARTEAAAGDPGHLAVSFRTYPNLNGAHPVA